YADDFIVTGRSKVLLEYGVQPLVEHFWSERGLELSHEKTRITHIQTGFDFLGQNLRRYATTGRNIVGNGHRWQWTGRAAIPGGRPPWRKACLRAVQDGLANQ